MTAPTPPCDIANREPHTTILRHGQIIHRFFSVAYEPLYFDRSLLGRLNAPDGSFGVLYVARRPEGAFAGVDSAAGK